MNVSYNWLKKHVDLEGLTPEEVARKLTFSGVEVEDIRYLASGTNLVIGEILSCEAHPDSDHLHVLNVDEGSFGVQQIVCGAPNARKGLKVIVARVGAKLPEVEIKASVIRGVESNGMCCSLLELGVDPKYLSDYQKAGIEELPLDAPVGESDVLGYLGLDDVVLELSVLPNRPDLYALNNVAREVACLFKREYTLDELCSYPLEKTTFKVGSTTKSCPLFSGRVIRGVKTKESPKWMQEVLMAAGIRSINNVVDIGNFAMLLSGQPLNMYDLDKLPEPSLTARDDLEGEFLAMDGNTYTLQKGDIVIASGDQPMCLGGIMTADACKVDENSRNIVVEAAYFQGAPIRHTSNRIGLSSDSSLRFCKGINPHQAEYVQEMVADLLMRYAEGTSVSETILYDEMDHSAKRVKTSLAYINARLGTDFTLEEVTSVLKDDGFVCEGDLEVEVPLYRIDIDGQADISEEVIRILGYERVPSILPFSSSLSGGLSEKQKKQRELRHYLLGHGVSEALTYTLVSKAETAKFSYLPMGEPFVLQNPMTVEREAVRTHLLHSLLLAASYNAARQIKSGALFEVSDVDSKSVRGRHLSIVLFGEKASRDGLDRIPYDFFDMKGLVEGIFELLGIGTARYGYFPWSKAGEEFHPYQTAEIKMGKQLVGYFGSLHPKALKAYGLRNVIGLELDLDALLNLKVSPVKAAIPPRFPSVTRDLALLVPSNVAYEDLRREILRSDALITGVSLFDLYSGEGVGENEVSMAVSLTLLSPEKTLSEAEVNLATKKALDALSVRFGVRMRQ